MIFRFGFDSRRKSKAVRLVRLREYKCSVPTRPPVSLSRGGKVPPGVPSSFLPLNHCVSPLSISLAVSPPSRVEWGDKSILSSLKVAYPCSCVLAETFFFPLSFSSDIHRLIRREQWNYRSVVLFILFILLFPTLSLSVGVQTRPQCTQSTQDSRAARVCGVSCRLTTG